MQGIEAFSFALLDACFPLVGGLTLLRTGELGRRHLARTCLCRTYEGLLQRRELGEGLTIAKEHVAGNQSVTLCARRTRTRASVNKQNGRGFEAHVKCAHAIGEGYPHRKVF
jgi:hypothetical protein